MGLYLSVLFAAALATVFVEQSLPKAEVEAAHAIVPAAVAAAAEAIVAASAVPLTAIPLVALAAKRLGAEDETLSAATELAICFVSAMATMVLWTPSLKNRAENPITPDMSYRKMLYSIASRM